MKGEFDFISGLRARASSGARADLIAGIGDDAAILQSSTGREILLTTDLLVEDIHFKLEYTSPTQLGHKALAVNLSDIAAMGGRPRYFLLSFARPASATEEFIESMIDGMLSLARDQGVELIGGDTCSARDKLFINITLIGDCASGKAVRRDTAKPGDLVFISGTLGGSAKGFELLSSGSRLTEGANETVLLLSHLLPQPRISLGAAIGERGIASSMIDVSDGLSSDMGHICEQSGVGVEIDASKLPIAEGASLENALNGGEDYELLFTASPERIAEIDKLRADFPNIEITEIGSISASLERKILIEGKSRPLQSRGYDHFK